MTSPYPAIKSAPSGEAEKLLAWYDRHHRSLPWRVTPQARAAGVIADPYRVWLSEVMLQQTTVAAVKSYFDAFTAAWPTVRDLAAADEADVMKAWAGLGYYSRARNLKKAAETIAEEHGGRFPDTEATLRALPGVGAYTAAAIAAIAFDRSAVVIDGNIERVVTRLRAISEPLPKARNQIVSVLSTILPAQRFGDFAQGMMDLGATICTPKRPVCALCPLNEDCAAYRAGEQERYPVKAAKAERPTRWGAAFVAVREDGAVMLRRRPPEGLLGGMSEVPGSAWTARADGDASVRAAPFAAEWIDAGVASHGFTHFELRLRIFRVQTNVLAAPAGHWWSTPEALPGEALPTVMKKAIEIALPGATKRKARRQA